MTRAVDLLKNNFGVSQLYKHDVIKNGKIILSVYWHPLTISEKELIVKQSGNLVDNFTYELMEGSIDNLGSILHENWERKKSISSSISSSWINEAYEEALKLGAKGGKILGAGNGGFFLFFCDPMIHNSIINGLPGMKKFDFNFDETGSQIVYSD